MSKILSTITTFITGIKWTPLKISIALNILLLIFIAFLFKSPKPIKPEVIIETHTITIPGKDGVSDTIFLPKPINIINPVNQELLNKYNSTKDDLVKLELFKASITERDYKTEYDDKIQKVTVNTKVQGSLLSQSIKYDIFPSTIQYQDTTVINYNRPATNKLLIGVEFGMHKINNPILKGQIGFQNKKDNIISLGYDTNKNIWIGYQFKISFR